jgi:tRNA dimethylallyltransferase
MLRVNVLCGPTASGKSPVGLYLAEQMGAEILSVDSMKLYRGLDIGTGKASVEERARVKHHLIDILDPSESFSVSQFLIHAEAVIRDCHTRGVPLIAEGGTALYLKALSEGIFDGPGKNDDVRQTLEADAETEGRQVLYERLKSIDPAAASRIMSTDLRRIVRALEVHALTGKPISELQQQWGTPRKDLDVRLACLNIQPREKLYARIDRRIDQMLADGWLDECRRLMNLEKPLSTVASKAIGYRTFMAHLRGEVELAPAIERTKFDTHHFARHQLKWYRKLPKLKWVEADENDSAKSLAQKVLRVFEEA